MSEDFQIGGVSVAAGERKTVEIHLARLYDYTELTLPIQIIRGKEDGPTLFVSGAIHGDELVGVAIVKKIANDRRLKKLKGTLIAIPIVNVFGFNSQSRYFPDRRDLNRSFPGSPKGSLASRVAHIFMREVVDRCQYGIDFHSGAIHRTNFPQIRSALDDEETRMLAEAFGAPVILNSKLRDGSLREAALEHGTKMLIFEGGEALRIEERVVKVGVDGAFAVMEKIGMLPESEKAKSDEKHSYVANSSYWVRAPQSGMIHFLKKLGARVKAGASLGTITDAYGTNRVKVKAPSEGIIIGQSQIPLVNKGDALFHIATFEDSSVVKELVEEYYDYPDN